MDDDELALRGINPADVERERHPTTDEPDVIAVMDEHWRTDRRRARRCAGSRPSIVWVKPR